ncbi:MAG: cobyrinate a,c-diamide synthase [Oscillospiraceae bacterium]|nr:cobyrinate a,c-diamide synthase [Oscillospiraceae bacterium]
MPENTPRIVFAGTNSGCGKTTMTCAVLQALVNRGLRVGAFKCGPDYIDPMFHSRIIGAKSSNLDLFFFDENTARSLLAENGADRDVCVIEGVMGFYDGMSLTTTTSSTYELAQVTDSPVILVVDAKGASLSILATIHGFYSLFPDNHICGVILNRCTAMTYPVLAGAIRERFGGAIEPLGFMPAMTSCSLESRHLGLVTAAEVSDLKEKMRLLAEQAEKTLDLDGILKLANSSPMLEYKGFEPRRFDERVRIAVARDKAFCFYYEDSLDVLRKMGAELVDFSPLTDKELPGNVQGLYLGGGYPELYAKTLSDNKTMLASVRRALESGLPCIAECGGFMYLTEKIGGEECVGLLRGECRDTGRLTRFGYVTLRAKRDNLLCDEGETIRGHEFHHWDCEETGDGFRAEKASGKAWDCVVATDSLYAGYPHFHFRANPKFAERFYEKCVKELHRNDR